MGIWGVFFCFGFFFFPKYLHVAAAAVPGVQKAGVGALPAAVLHLPPPPRARGSQQSVGLGPTQTPLWNTPQDSVAENRLWVLLMPIHWFSGDPDPKCFEVEETLNHWL